MLRDETFIERFDGIVVLNLIGLLLILICQNKSMYQLLLGVQRFINCSSMYFYNASHAEIF